MHILPEVIAYNDSILAGGAHSAIAVAKNK